MRSLRINLSFAGKILNFVRPHRWQFLAVVLQMFVLSGLELLTPWPLKLVIDTALNLKPIILCA